VDIFAFQELFKEKFEVYKLDFKNYEEFNHKSGKEDMLTFILKKYNPKIVKKGEFESGRPFIINSLTINNQNVIFINVHPSNKQPKKTQETLDKDDLKKLQKAIDKKTFDRLILAGDFNRSPNQVVLNNITATNILEAKYRSERITCCNNKGKGIVKYGFVDNVLDSYYDIKDKNYKLEVISEGSTNNIGSDHNPILATLPLNKFFSGGAGGEYTYNKNDWEIIGRMFIKNKGGNHRAISYNKF